MSNETKTKSVFDCAVYTTKDIMALYDVSVNDINRKISEGLIPQPLPSKSRSSRKWSRAAVDRALGISLTDNRNLRKIVREEVTSILMRIADDNRPKVPVEGGE